MRLLIMLPQKAGIDGYIQLPLINDIRYSGLISYEDNANALKLQLEKLIRILTNRYVQVSTGSLPAEILCTTPAVLNGLDSNTNLENMLLEMNRQFRDLEERAQQLLSTMLRDGGSHKEKGPDNMDTAAMPNNSGSNPNQFVTCFEVTVDKSKLKGFLKEIAANLGIDYLVAIGKEGSKLQYKVYCLRNEANALLERLGHEYKCGKIACEEDIISTINASSAAIVAQAGVKLPRDADKPADDRARCLALLLGAIQEASQLYIDSLAYSVYIESLQLFGVSEKISYSLMHIKGDKCNKELRKIKKLLIARKVVDQNSDEEEYPFAYGIIKDAGSINI